MCLPTRRLTIPRRLADHHRHPQSHRPDPARTSMTTNTRTLVRSRHGRSLTGIAPENSEPSEPTLNARVRGSSPQRPTIGQGHELAERRLMMFVISWCPTLGCSVGAPEPMDLNDGLFRRVLICRGRPPRPSSTLTTRVGGAAVNQRHRRLPTANAPLMAPASRPAPPSA
jgi:hypothetical protein